MRSSVKVCWAFVAMIAICLVISSCGSSFKKDLTTEVNKNGSIASNIYVKQLDSLHDILVTRHIVWRQGKQEKLIERLDTIPALGSEPVEIDNHGVLQMVKKKKEYEVFITVH